jgi:hypothetical protein
LQPPSPLTSRRSEIAERVQHAGDDRNFILLQGMVGREGLEPSTNGLRVRCSTN